MTVTIRHVHSSDYGRIIGRVNVWWGGRDMAPMLPKLFFVHFEGTSFVAEDEEGQLAGFTDDEENQVGLAGLALWTTGRAAWGLALVLVFVVTLALAVALGQDGVAGRL